MQVYESVWTEAACLSGLFVIGFAISKMRGRHLAVSFEQSDMLAFREALADGLSKLGKTSIHKCLAVSSSSTYVACRRDHSLCMM